MSERERFKQWAVSDERGDDFIEALSWPGSNVNRNRHAMTGWIGHARRAGEGGVGGSATTTD